ncbi:MAG TPA: carboxypeptidase regulatory-like domain-containing protein [Bacteroidales bacterium]|nr:carboxypeptidase regulatory-like domain-containing protein [Bacteroidales bacterium]
MRKLNFILFVSAIMFFVFTGCNKTPKEDDTPVNTNYVIKTVSGIVTDQNEFPLTGVEVNVNGNTTTTDQSGSFVLPDILVSKDSFLIKFYKDGYFHNIRSGEITEDKNIRVRAGLIDKSVASNTQFQTTAGGVLSISQGGLTTTVTFPNDLKYLDENGNSYTGQVIATGYYADPSANNFSMLTCGVPIGRDSTSAKRHLSSYGAIYLEITDNQGGLLQLDQTSPSFPQIAMAIPTALIGSAPNDIFIWSNDFNRSYSNSEGYGSKQGGHFVCQVRHFSYWQTAVPATSSATVLGRVRDANGKKVPGVKVTIGQYYAVTDFNGLFKLIVPNDMSLDVHVLPQDYFGQSSNTVTVGPLNSGETDTVELVVPAMQTFSGNIVNCVGGNIAGFVKITFSYGQNTASVQTFTTDGNFILHIPQGITSATLSAFALGVWEEIQLSSDGTTGGSEDIEVCVLQYGPTDITISGGIYGSGRTFELGPFFYREGYYISSSGKTNISCDGGGGIMDISFTGQKGTYPIYPSSGYKVKSAGDTAIIFTLYFDNKYFTINSGELYVTHYDNVGGLIEGNFSGVGILQGDTTINEYRISGRFSARRTADQ